MIQTKLLQPLSRRFRFKGKDEFSTVKHLTFYLTDKHLNRKLEDTKQLFINVNVFYVVRQLMRTDRQHILGKITLKCIGVNGF